MHDEIKKYVSIVSGTKTIVESSYDNRVQQVVDAMIANHSAVPFKSKAEIQNAIHDVSRQLNISDYKMGGQTQREFFKDVVSALKGKLTPNRKMDPAVKAQNAQDKNSKLQTILCKIYDAAGQAFPDGDPTDVLSPWLYKKGYVKNYDNVLPVLDKAAKLGGHKNYYDILSSMWDDFAKDNPGNEMGVTVDSNPWRTNEAVEPDKRYSTVKWVIGSAGQGNPQYIVKLNDNNGVSRFIGVNSHKITMSLSNYTFSLSGKHIHDRIYLINELLKKSPTAKDAAKSLNASKFGFTDWKPSTLPWTKQQTTESINMRFKAGDKVKCIDPKVDSNWPKLQKGKIYTVAATDADGLEISIEGFPTVSPTSKGVFWYHGGRFVKV